MERLDDLLAHGGERRCPLLVGLRLLDRLQPEQHRGQLLAGLVVQLAREPAALELLRLDDPAQRVAGDARREVDRDGGAGREGLGEPQVGLGEAGVAAFAVVRDEHADRPAARPRAVRRARCERRGAGPTPGRPRDRRASESIRSARRRSSTRPLFEPARSSCRPTISAAPSPSAASIRSVPSPAGSAIVTSARADQLAQAAGDQLEQPRQLDLARQRRPDLVQRLELVRPGGRRLVEARVLDRDRGLARERLDELLVGGGERRPRASPSGRGSRRRGREAGSARRGSRASADGGAGSRRSADRR